MRKNLFIVAALLLPAALCAQSALQQAERMAGMSRYDVYVPPPGDPVPVDPDPEEEESQPQQSTHLKDYTPAQETTQPAPEPKPKTFADVQQERVEREKTWQEQEQQRLAEIENAYWKGREEDRERSWHLYNSFLKSQPQVQSVPVFSGINEKQHVFDQPTSPNDLQDYGSFYLGDNDSDYKVDMIRYTHQSYPNAYFLGRKLENGRTEWRIFTQDRVKYGTLGNVERYDQLGFPSNFDYRQIRDVEFKGEGRIALLKMADGTIYALRPDGSVICHGRKMSSSVISYELSGGSMYIECDGKLYSSGSPRFAGPVLEGDHFDYYNGMVIVTKHDAEGKPFYNLSTYGGRSFDYKENAWKVKGDYAAFDYIAPFSNDGNYCILQPRGKKQYIIVSYLSGRLYKGKGTYKSIEAAHEAWPKEKKYMTHLYYYKPDKRTKYDE